MFQQQSARKQSTRKQQGKCLDLHPDGDRRKRRPADRKRQGYEHPRQHSAGQQGHGQDRRQSQHRDLAGKRNLRGEEHIGRLRSLVGYSRGKILQAHIRPFGGQRNDRLRLPQCERPVRHLRRQRRLRHLRRKEHRPQGRRHCKRSGCGKEPPLDRDVLFQRFGERCGLQCGQYRCYTTYNKPTQARR